MINFWKTLLTCARIQSLSCDHPLWNIKCNKLITSWLMTNEKINYVFTEMPLRLRNEYFRNILLAYAIIRKTKDRYENLLKVNSRRERRKYYSSSDFSKLKLSWIQRSWIEKWANRIVVPNRPLYTIHGLAHLSC